MIYDRTAEDIEKARQIREEKLKNFIALTTAEIETIERGMLTNVTLNRIESKQAELRYLLQEMRYFLTTTQRSWTIPDIFYDTDFERILDNCNRLKKSFFTYSTTPITPSAKCDYETFNAIEKILADIEAMIYDVRNNYRECGNYECGQG